MQKKIIIMFSAKRCGSTAILNLFQKHKEVKILHKQQDIINWEPQYWTYAYSAINGEVINFNNRIKDTLNIEEYYLKNEYNEELIFELFDIIFNQYGPIIFDKSPQYLGSKKSVELLMKYELLRPDIKFIFFSFIRNPLDAIASQHELWGHYTEEKSLELRENNWLKMYSHLEELQKIKKIKLYKYEEFCEEPQKFTKNLMEYCGLEYSDYLCSHLKSTSVGRYYISPYKKIRSWKINNDLKEHMKKYGYDEGIYKKIKFRKKIKILVTSLKRILVPIYEKFFK